MKRLEKVYWIDEVNGKVKSGLLHERIKVVATANINSEGDIENLPRILRQVMHYEWDILGDDGKRYSIPEKEIVTKKGLLVS